jgi:AraC family transcriptional regulator, regulatory protein of adaptative response / methylated-DNA-[protein]-cysteine methyltransferase
MHRHSVNPAGPRKPGGVAAPALRYVIAPSDLGLILVAESGRGICAISIGDDEQSLREELLATFPDSTAGEATARLRQVWTDVSALLAKPSRGLDHALDMCGTPFQERVWNALRVIPAGCMQSYTEVAHRIGQPAAARAVARACAANVLAVAIPCHRVLGNTGALSGYRWGLARKQELLRREGQLS